MEHLKGKAAFNMSFYKNISQEEKQALRQRMK